MTSKEIAVPITKDYREKRDASSFAIVDRAALTRILDYLWDSEYKYWTDIRGPMNTEFIFHALAVVQSDLMWSLDNFQEVRKKIEEINEQKTKQAP